MKHTIQAAAVVLLAASAAHAQQAVQWRVQDGGNGHWYQRVESGGSVSWTSAKSAAENMGGYLACIASALENTWLWNNLVQPSSTSGWDGWIGLYQTGQSEPTGGWGWISGEPLSFTSWCGNQPDDSQGSENYGHFITIHGPGCWNDIRADGSYAGVSYIHDFIVEWSADCNIDGVVDYGQCRDGTLPDYNANNVPDCCERGEPCAAGSYPVRWGVADGGNGHWYQQLVEPASFVSQQRAAASLGATIVCIEDLAENAFVFGFARSRGMPSIWIGLAQDSFGAEPDIGWRWLNGVDSEWRNWGAGEPNNWQYDEDNCVMIVNPAPQDQAYWPARWQDYPGFWNIPAVIEWSSDCNADNIVDYGQILDGTFPDGNLNGVPDCCEVGGSCCPGDIIVDHVIDGADLGALLFFWGPVGSSPDSRAADLNLDGIVSGADLGLLLAGWGTCP